MSSVRRAFLEEDTSKHAFLNAELMDERDDWYFVFGAYRSGGRCGDFRRSAEGVSQEGVSEDSEDRADASPRSFPNHDTVADAMPTGVPEVDQGFRQEGSEGSHTSLRENRLCAGIQRPSVHRRERRHLLGRVRRLRREQE